MSNIDEKAKNNLTIEMRIFENYEKVKYEIIRTMSLNATRPGFNPNLKGLVLPISGFFPNLVS